MPEKIEELIGKKVLSLAGTSKVVSTGFSLNDKIPLLFLEDGFVLNACVARDEHGVYIFP